MFFLETDGSLNIVFDRSSTVEGLLAAFKDAIDGQLLLHEAFLLQHPNLPSGYFNGALVIDDFFAVSALPLFVSACLDSIFFGQIRRICTSAIQRRCHEFQQSYRRGEPAGREQVFLGGKNDRASAAGWLHLGEKSTARPMESLIWKWWIRRCLRM
jgi:hypothetical protein